MLAQEMSNHQLNQQDGADQDNYQALLLDLPPLPQSLPLLLLLTIAELS
jgi:hypothetical protein